MASPRQGMKSTVGLKFLVAVTGALLVVFVFFHMVGNLQIYIGQEAINRYAAFLKSVPELLWAARAGLLLAFLVHIACIAQLTWINRGARPTRYAVKKPVESTFASRTMVLSGVVLLAFVVYHLMNFTWGVTHPELFALHDAEGRHDVYSMTVLSFRDPVVTISYLIAMGFLGLHLVHGVAAFFQSTGFNNHKFLGWTRRFAVWFTALVVLGNISIPLMCFLRVIKLPEGVDLP